MINKLKAYVELNHNNFDENKQKKILEAIELLKKINPNIDEKYIMVEKFTDDTLIIHAVLFNYPTWFSFNYIDNGILYKCRRGICSIVKLDNKDIVEILRSDLKGKED